MTLKIAALLAALLAAGVGVHFVDAQYYGKQLAVEKQARADDLAKINAASAQALQDALSKQQAAEGKVATLETQYQQEVANHAKDSLDYRAKLASGSERVRVRVANCGSGTASGKSASPASGADGSASYAELPAASAERLVTVTDSADAEVTKLRALQQYVTALQEQGFVGK